MEGNLHWRTLFTEDITLCGKENGITVNSKEDVTCLKCNKMLRQQEELQKLERMVNEKTLI